MIVPNGNKSTNKNAIAAINYIERVNGVELNDFQKSALLCIHEEGHIGILKRRQVGMSRLMAAYLEYYMSGDNLGNFAYVCINRQSADRVASWLNHDMEVNGGDFRIATYDSVFRNPDLLRNKYGLEMVVYFDEWLFRQEAVELIANQGLLMGVDKVVLSSSNFYETCSGVGDGSESGVLSGGFIYKKYNSDYLINGYRGEKVNKGNYSNFYYSSKECSLF
jgi:hypothetical protein